MTEQELQIRTMDVFADYERRFALATASRPRRALWTEEGRTSAIQAVKEVLSFRDELVPQIRIVSENAVKMDGFTIYDTVYESFAGFYGCFSRYMPDSAAGRLPTIFICPGHGKQGRLTESSQAMAARLVRQGAAVMHLDNIGQGERIAQGHWDVVMPFACGLSLQGLILMETVAMIRWAAKQDFCDPAQIGACGNSGGGTLTTFLASLAPELAALASCGYPSEFGYILQKERKHCACNMLPHVMGKLDMWESLACFAPKPLLLEMGNYDNLIPTDYFQRAARKVGQVYAILGEREQFSHRITDTKHPWDVADRALIGNFFAKQFPALAPTAEEPENPADIRPVDSHTVTLPADGLTTDELAQSLTGKHFPADIALEDVYPVPADVVPDLGRGPVRRVLAQMEMSL